MHQARISNRRNIFRCSLPFYCWTMKLISTDLRAVKRLSGWKRVRGQRGRYEPPREVLGLRGNLSIYYTYFIDNLSVVFSAVQTVIKISEMIISPTRYVLDEYWLRYADDMLHSDCDGKYEGILEITYFNSSFT